MPIWYKFLAILAVFAMVAAPALADGTPGTPVNRGPEPLTPHQPEPPVIENTEARSCCGTTTRRIVKTHPPVVTKRTVTHRAAPQETVTRRTITSRQTVREDSEVRLDLASFTGGVGNGIDGGFYGGGGAIIITGGQSFSGVLSHRASAYTFSHRGHRGGHGGKKRGQGGGCGC